MNEEHCLHHWRAKRYVYMHRIRRTFMTYLSVCLYVCVYVCVRVLWKFVHPAFIASNVLEISLISLSASVISPN